MTLAIAASRVLEATTFRWTSMSVGFGSGFERSFFRRRYSTSSVGFFFRALAVERRRRSFWQDSRLHTFWRDPA